MGMLLTAVLLLGACSGGSAPVEQHNATENSGNQEENLPTQPVPTQEATDPTEPVPEDYPPPDPAISKDWEPTPSVPFVQSYDPNPVSDRDYSEYNIVTLLPPDAIPSINNPSFTDVSQADEKYDPDEMVLGVEFNGDARAYSVGLLSNHEIVNDTVGGIHLAVTW
jgi:hypothetical protein